MSDQKRTKKIIISGGGTGGHVFPAIAIANAIKAIEPLCDILFVGAQGKIEMEKVPKAGFKIKGLWISGFHRKLTLRNLMFPIKLLSSLFRSFFIVQTFKPQVVVGVGGFASGPVLEVASRLGIPSLIQEQNSYAGLTNKLLAKRVDKICVSYDGMERFFPKNKLVMTGNPVRKDFLDKTIDPKEAYKYFDLNPDKKTIFVFGGSLGAASINRAMNENTKEIDTEGIQVLWQVGKLYFEEYRNSPTANLANVKILPFVDRMDLAYAIADLVVCRAGALTISELSLLGQAAILIPSPNVAEDHQTKNAMALVEKDAALMIKDAEAKQLILRQAKAVLGDERLRQKWSENIKKLSRPEAAQSIAREVLSLMK